MPRTRSGLDTASRPERTPRTRRRSQSIPVRSGGIKGYWKKSINDQHPNPADTQISSETSMEIDLQSKAANVPQQNADSRSDFEDQISAQQTANQMINSNAIGSNTISTTANNSSNSISNWEEDFETMTVAARIAGVVQLETVTGSTLKEKINFIKHIIMEFPEFLSVNTAIIEGKKLIKITFTDLKGFEKCSSALAKEKIILENLVKPSSEEIAAYRDIKARRKIFIKDISAETSHVAIRSIFESYGTIVACRTTIHGPWKSAEIEYATEEEATNVHELKAIPIQRDICRIYPWNEVEFIEDIRRDLTLRLTNLPYGTTGYDIWNYVHSIGGTTCFIPKAQTKMTRRRHAYVCFNSLEEKEAIENKQINIKGYIAQWLDPEIRTCFICEEAGHIATECHWKKEKQITMKNNWKLATKYNQMGINPREVPRQIATIMKQTTPSRSYASAVKDSSSAKSNPSRIPENKLSHTQASFVQHVESKFNDIEKRFDKLEEAILKLTSMINKGKFNLYTSQTPIPSQAQENPEMNSILSPDIIPSMNFSNFSSPIAISTPLSQNKNESSPSPQNPKHFPKMAPLHDEEEQNDLQIRCSRLEMMIEQLTQ